MRKKTLCGFLLLLSLGCTDQSAQQQQRELTYFDIKGYFETEVNRLNKLKPSITKSVEINDSLERKAVRILDWKKELSIFSEADINRASWKGLFKLEKHDGTDIYTSDDEKVPVKKLALRFEGKRIKQILIVLNTDNSLYDSKDSLSYYPDSLYRIKKTQHIKLLSSKHYEIQGLF